MSKDGNASKAPQTRSTLKNREKQLLNSHGYKIKKVLGIGSYGKVYAGEFQSSRDRSPIVLACKVIDAQKAGQRFMDKFLPRELAILSKVDHPHIIRIHSIFTSGTKYYIFMRYAENTDVYTYMKKHGAINEDQARVWTRQLALAIQYLHILEIAHRDIKDRNVLVTARLNVKLSDFGFSRILLDEQGEYSLCKTFCGSIQYIAPEILQKRKYDAKSADMWSLGVLIFVILNNNTPFQSKKTSSLLSRQLAKKWSICKNKESVLSSHVKSVLESLIEPDPEKRWSVHQLVRCQWIGMVPKLHLMDKEEYDAFMQAIDDMKLLKDSGKGYVRKAMTYRRPSPAKIEAIKFYKKGSLAFYLDTLQSEIKFFRKKVKN